MDRSFNSSSGSSLSGTGSGSHIEHGNASQILKDLLNVGKSSPQQQVYSSTGNKVSRSVESSSPNVTGGQVGLGQDMNRASGDSAVSRSLDHKQTILLDGDDRSGSVRVYGPEVIVVPSDASRRDSSAPGSNKVKITPVVKYDWEHKYYVGNLVAVNQIYLVYVLKIQSGYGLRILDRRSSMRTLLKGFEEIVTDVAFAHHQSNVLGCIDRLGNLTVWQISQVDGKILPTSKLKVKRPLSCTPSDYHRLVWCPYLPDEPTSSDSSSVNDENSRLLAITHDEKAEFWDLDLVVELYGMSVNSDDVVEGVIRVYKGHTKPITDLSVAPDGQVLATASEDGTVKFWQMDMAAPDQAPSRLHRFTPHSGQPVSALIFCDNHKYQDPDLPFWRFLITGARSNQELTMWCTVTWTCLQKINFVQPSPSGADAFLKIKLDLSARYLIVSDITRKVLYVFQVYQDHEEGRAHMSSLTEFLLTQPTLSFAIVDAGRCRLKPLTDEGEDADDLNSAELSEIVDVVESRPKSSLGVIVKMFCIDSKSVQDVQVRFQPKPSVDQESTTGSVSSASQDDYALQDGLSDMSMSTDHSVDGLLKLQLTGSLTSSFTSDTTANHSQPYLMTPDAITSGSPQTLAEHLREGNNTSCNSNSSSSFTQISNMNISIDELLSSHNTSDLTRVISPITPATITPSSSLPATPSSPVTPAFPLPSEAPPPLLPDEGPKSPPPTPTDSAPPPPTRLKEKRISDSSAEVALILQSNLDESQGRGRGVGSEELMDDDEPIPVVVDAVPLNEVEKQPVKVTQSDAVMDDEVNETAVQCAADQNEILLGPEDIEICYGIINFSDVEKEVNLSGESTPAAGTPTVGASRIPEEIPVPVPLQLLEVQEQEYHSEHSSDVDPSDIVSQTGAKSKMKGQRRDKASRSSPRARKSPGPREPGVDVVQMNNTLQQVLSLLQAEQLELKQIRQDQAKSQQSNSVVQSIRSRMDKLEKNLQAKLDATLTKHSDQERQRLSAALQERQSLDKQKQERLLECVSQNLNKSVTSRLDKTVRSEIESKVLPELHRVIGPLSEQLNTTMAQKLTATDQLMKENISKLVKSRNTTDAIGQSAASSLGVAIQSSYRDVFRTSVVPAFEQSCQSLFVQVNAAFEAGTRQYTQQLESHLNKIQHREKESRDPIIAEMFSLVETCKANTETLKSTVLNSVQSVLAETLHKANERMEADLLAKLRKVVKEEVEAALRDHQQTVESSIAAVVRSQAATPVPQGPDIRQVQATINQLLQQNRIMEAFQNALSAADLRAVLFVCQSVNADDLFARVPFPLDQPVLLSLIQQLSHDFGHSTPLKLKYIDEALVILAEDTANTQFHEHLPIVIGDLCRQISTFVQMNPTNRNVKQMKRLLLLAKSLDRQ